MKKPIHGEELTIRYKGAVLKTLCGEVTDLPVRGAGAAKFNIVCKTAFQRGGDATLVEGGFELPIKVERVTVMGHNRLNIVSLSGEFESKPVQAAYRGA
jgi:hypothetical protein